MKKNLERYIFGCEICGRAQNPNPKRKQELELFRVEELMEQLGIDYIGGGTFPETLGGYRYILDNIDQLTKWAVAVPVRDQTAKTVVKAIINCWVT